MLSVFKKRESKSVFSQLSKAEKKIIRAWCMYDWANSAFFTSIVSAIMPIYFVGLYRESLGSGVVFFNFQFSATVVWALTGALGTFLIALSSPIFGVIADRSGIKKKLMTIFCVSGCLATIMLFFSSYTSSPWLFSLAFYFLGAIGAAGANVFYNSLLPHIAPENLLDDVSSRGYAYGYLGGGLLLLIHLIVLVFFDYSDLAIRSCLASVGVWWFGWALWTLKVVPEPNYKKTKKIGVSKSIYRAVKQIKSTAGEFKQFKQLLIFLIAFVIFNDAIATCLGIAGAYGLDVLRISPETATLTILIVQFVAFPGSLFFSYLAKKLDTKKSLSIAVIGWGIIAILALGFAPLKLDNHNQYDYQLSYLNNNYDLKTSPTLSETNKNEVYWADINSTFLDKELISLEEAKIFLSNFKIPDCKFSISFIDGPLDGESEVCESHPTFLNQNVLDRWPKLLRSIVWQPLSLNQDTQFLIMGIFVGMFMGGAQALGRSLFAYMTPKSRSGEFFGFFSFSWRSVSVLGPLSYAILAGFYSPRVGLAFLGLQIFIGLYILKFVNVEEGRKVAIEQNRENHIIR
ncbi:MAG: MFS transporter [Chloroflexota bacterium]|nr:MFS transporter [Chloroflexota bacterium]